MNNRPHRPEAAPTIHLIGDSTMANKCLLNNNPERGWGQVLHEFFHPEVCIFNHARDGRSSKSFVWEGLWDAARAAMLPGDWLVIQFGHNDQKTDRPLLCTEPHGDYLRYLSRFVREADDAGAFPVFATSIHRRRFNHEGMLVDTLGEHPAAMRHLARQFDVPLLDLHEQTGVLLQSLGPAASKRLFLHFSPGQHPGWPDGRCDDTHLSLVGARMVANLFAQSLRDYPWEIARWLRPARLARPRKSTPPTPTRPERRQPSRPCSRF